MMINTKNTTVLPPITATSIMMIVTTIYRALTACQL